MLCSFLSFTHLFYNVLVTYKIYCVGKTSVGWYHGTTVEPWYFIFTVPVSTVEVTVIPWYRNTTNTAVLPYGIANK